MNINGYLALVSLRHAPKNLISHLLGQHFVFVNIGRMVNK